MVVTGDELTKAIDDRTEHQRAKFWNRVVNKDDVVFAWYVHVCLCLPS